MDDPRLPRAWTHGCGLLAFPGGAAAANGRIATSSVGSISLDIDPPCVLALLGSRRPGHRGNRGSAI